jgi:endo-1,3-1,4-beta-glycanase ExoK
MKSFVLAALMVLLSATAQAGSLDKSKSFEYRFTKAPLPRDVWFISDGWVNGDHQSCEWLRSAITQTDNSLVMTMSDKGGKLRKVGCAELRTQKKYSYGRYEVRMRTASGSGLNSNMFTFTGPVIGGKQHDEIDFEFLGKEPNKVQLNYWVAGKGGHEEMIDLGFDASKDFHNYVFDWQKDKITWTIDGKQVHQTEPGAVMPSTPGHIFLSLWSGSKIINDWLGPFNYKQPVTAEVQWVKFTPAK